MKKIVSLAFVLVLILLLSPVLPARAEESPAECLVSFDTLRNDLGKAIAKSGSDAEKGTFHFVVLMNTVRTNGPRARAVRDLYNGLLSQYMIQNDKYADKVSFSPFELDLWGGSVWNETFRKSRIRELYALAPKSPQIRNGSLGGHDDERALLSALSRVELPKSTVIIILSDSEVSEPPVRPGEYGLAAKDPEFTKTLETTGFELATRGRIEGRNVDGAGQPVPFAVFYSIYAPSSLQPLAELESTSRSELLAKISQTTQQQSDNRPEADGSAEIHPVNWTAIVLIVLVLLLVGVAVWYWSFINKTQFVQIGGLQGSVRYGKPTYIGGDPDDQQCIALPELSGRQKVAVLEVQAKGNVIIRNHGKFQVSCGSERNVIVLSTIDKTISVKNTQANSYIQFNARVVSS